MCALLILVLVGGGAAEGAGRRVPRVGPLRLLVLRAAFPDRPLERPRGEIAALIDRFESYFREVSAGRLQIHGYLAHSRVVLPSPRQRYVQASSAMATDALQAFDAIARHPRDREALAHADAVIVFFAGPGKESHAADDDQRDPWSNFTTLARLVQGFDRGCVVAEQELPPFENFGVLCHEFGHLLGLPELYATGGLPQEGIGVWGLMGHGTWLEKGAAPPHPEAWSKARLGWVDVQEIGSTTLGVELPAVEEVPRVVRIPAVPGGRREEYYLLENRQRIGFDQAIKGEGVLVWHVDERAEQGRSSQNDAAHKLLHLVEADGRGDLDRGHAAGGNRGDATDPWAGPPRWRRRVGAALGLAGGLFLAAALTALGTPHPLRPMVLRMALAAVTIAGAIGLRRGPVCGPGTPGMAPYGGEPVAVVIRNISPTGRRMSADILVAPRAGGG